MLEREFGDYGYMFVLRLFQVQTASRGLNLPIPETVLFSQGVSKLHLSFLGDEVKTLRPREAYTNTTIRKIFTDKDYLTQKDMGTRSGTRDFEGPPLSLEEKEAGRLTRPFVFVKSLETQNTTRLLSYFEFIKLVELRKTHKVWLDMKLIQSAKVNSEESIELVKVKFDHKKVDQQLLRRTDFELQIRDNKVPTFSEHFVSPQEEEEFKRVLRKESPREFCRYLCCKIFSFVRAQHRVTLKKFLAEFYSDGTTLWFCGARLIELDFFHLAENIAALSYKKPDSDRPAREEAGLEEQLRPENRERQEQVRRRKEEQKKQLLLEMELISSFKGKSLFKFKRGIAKKLNSVEPTFEFSNHKRLGNIFTNLGQDLDSPSDEIAQAYFRHKAGVSHKAGLLNRRLKGQVSRLESIYNDKLLELDSRAEIPEQPPARARSLKRARMTFFNGSDLSLGDTSRDQQQPRTLSPRRPQTKCLLDLNKQRRHPTVKLLHQTSHSVKRNVIARTKVELDQTMQTHPEFYKTIDPELIHPAEQTAILKFFRNPHFVKLIKRESPDQVKPPDRRAVVRFKNASESFWLDHNHEAGLQALRLFSQHKQSADYNA